MPGIDALSPTEPESTEPESAAGYDATWPGTMLVSAGFLLLLAAALSVPFVMTAPSLTEAILFLPALALGVVATRWTFGGRPAYEPGRVRPYMFVPAFGAATVGVLGTILSASGLGLGLPSLVSIAISAALSAAVLVSAAAARSFELRYLEASRRVFLVARDDQVRDVRREARRVGGIAVVGALDPRTAATQPTDILTRLDATRATLLVLSSGAAADVNVCAAAAQFNRQSGRVRELNRFYERHFRKVPLGELTPSWFLFDIAEIHKPLLYRAGKRALESLVAAVTLVLLAPVLLLIAVAVALTSRGPVFFRQQRVGLNDRPFTLLKFRTMHEAAPGTPADWAGNQSHRVTQVGAVLRRWRLDELPQLWNVGVGHMSLVGPRPEQVALVERLEEEIPYYRARHCVRPGLTGWAQVNFGYGGSAAGTVEKLQYDFFYVRNQGFRLDVLTIVMTARAVLRGLE